MRTKDGRDVSQGQVRQKEREDEGRGTLTAMRGLPGGIEMPVDF